MDERADINPVEGGVYENQAAWLGAGASGEATPLSRGPYESLDLADRARGMVNDYDQFKVKREKRKK
jgi:hypothetical protein